MTYHDPMQAQTEKESNDATECESYGTDVVSHEATARDPNGIDAGGAV